jgi:2-dehydropantoate 2-reductase
MTGQGVTMADRDPGLAFVGAGTLGQIFSASLAAAGQPVTLLATPGTAARLLTAGCLRLLGLVDLTVPAAPAPAPAGVVGVTADARDLPAGAGVVFTTKGHQLPGAIATVRAAWPAAGDASAWVAGIQNGMQKDTLLIEAFGAERVVGAVTITAGQRDPDGTIVLTSRGASYFGEFPRGRSERATAAASAITAAGLPAEAVEDIRSVLWSKEANAVGVFGVSVLTRLAGPRMMRRPDLAGAYLALIREVDSVARADGVAMGDYTGFPIRTYLDHTDDANIAFFSNLPFNPSADPSRDPLPSMTQDLLAGRALEVDAVFTDCVERAARLGVAVPRITLVRDLIRGLDVGHYPA